jgi:phage terminase large subunit GpA-like protein
VELCLVDQGWQRDLVHQFCRQSGHGAVLMPSRGQGITASQKPISEYDRKRGDHIGHNWWVPGVKGRSSLRHVELDTNFWKSFLQERLSTAMGDRGCLSLWGDKPSRHRLFAEHLAAEYRVRTEGRGRRVDEWKLPPGKPDNHWLDCLVGCAAAASMRGIKLAGVMEARPGMGKRKKIRLSDIQRRKQLERGRYIPREGLW